MSHPLVSVIMSTYNEVPSELESAIDSILKQTLTELELIVVLDAPDNADLRATLERLSRQDARLKVLINEKNRGLAASLNRALEASVATIIARMDADDIAEPERLTREHQRLVADDLDVVSANISYIDASGQPIGERDAIPDADADIKLMMDLGLTIFHPTVMFRRDVIQAVGGYNHLATAEDLDLWLRVRRADKRFGAISEPLLKYRQRDSSMTSNYWRNYLYAATIRDFYQTHPQVRHADPEIAETIRQKVELSGLHHRQRAKVFNMAYQARGRMFAAIRARRLDISMLVFAWGWLISSDIRRDWHQYLNYRKQLAKIYAARSSQ